MKVRRNFEALPEDVSGTPVHDAVSLTQPDMSLSVQQIVEQFAFVGDTPLGMMQYEEPTLKEDMELLCGAVDLDGLNIAELEELSVNLMERANYLRSQPPAAPAAVPDVGTKPNPAPSEEDK